MTILAGFTSVERQVSFLGADDLEGIRRKRNDKILCLFDRFLVGAIGNTTAYYASGTLGALGSNTAFSSGEDFSVPNSIEQLCVLVQQILPRVSRSQYDIMQRMVKQQAFSADSVALLEKQPSVLLIIDTQQHRGVLAHFGTLFPPRDHYNVPVCSPLPEGIPFYASNEIPSRSGVLIDDVIKDPFIWCDEVITQVRLDREKRGFSDIGHMGAGYLVTSGIMRKRTAFSSIDELVALYHPV